MCPSLVSKGQANMAIPKINQNLKLTMAQEAIIRPFRKMAGFHHLFMGNGYQNTGGTKKLSVLAPAVLRDTCHITFACQLLNNGPFQFSAGDRRGIRYFEYTYPVTEEGTGKIISTAIMMDPSRNLPFKTTSKTVTAGFHVCEYVAKDYIVTLFVDGEPLIDAMVIQPSAAHVLQVDTTNNIVYEVHHTSTLGRGGVFVDDGIRLSNDSIYFPGTVVEVYGYRFPAERPSLDIAQGQVKKLAIPFDAPPDFTTTLALVVTFHHHHMTVWISTGLHETHELDFIPDDFNVQRVRIFNMVITRTPPF